MQKHNFHKILNIKKKEKLSCIESFSAKHVVRNFQKVILINVTRLTNDTPFYGTLVRIPQLLHLAGGFLRGFAVCLLGAIVRRQSTEKSANYPFRLLIRA